MAFLVLSGKPHTQVNMLLVLDKIREVAQSAKKSLGDILCLFIGNVEQSS